MAMQALDTFVAEIDGTPFSVVKGQVFPDSHPLVKHDGGRGLLFAPLDMGDADPKPAKAAVKGRGREMPLTPPGYKVWENTTALAVANPAILTGFYDTTGYTTILITCVIANSTGTTTYTMEGSFDGSTLDSTMTYTIAGNTASTAAGGTSVVVQHPYVRFRVVQATATATTSTFFAQSRA